MIQYIIKKDNSYKFMRDVYNKFLCKEKGLWHYFYEGNYMLIRLEKRNKVLESYFIKKKVAFDFRDYSDPHQLVRKYQDIFKEILHQYSVLSMILKKDEFREGLDRIIHCFCNMSWELQVKNETDECHLVGTYLIGRAKYEGYFIKQNEIEKRKRNE